MLFFRRTVTLLDQNDSLHHAGADTQRYPLAGLVSRPMLPLWSPAKCNLGPPHVFRCSRCPAGRVRSVCARICRQTYEQKRLPGRYKRPARPRGRRGAWLSRDRVGAHAAAARRAAPLRLAATTAPVTPQTTRPQPSSSPRIHDRQRITLRQLSAILLAEPPKKSRPWKG